MTDRLDDPIIYHDAEGILKQRLADLHVQYRRQAEPIIRQLSRLDSMKPPRAIWLEGDRWAVMKPDVLEKLWPEEAKRPPESPNARMARLEHERDQLHHLLRMIRSTVPGRLPDFLVEEIDQQLK